MTDEVLYQNSDVRITPGGADFAGMTYSVRNITSVQMVTEPSQRMNLIVLAVLVGAIALALGVVGQSFMCAGVCATVTLLLVAIALASKPKHHIRLVTSGGQIQAYTTMDGDHAARISLALKEAITR
jgi:hypothetical protein